MQYWIADLLIIRVTMRRDRWHIVMVSRERRRRAWTLYCKQGVWLGYGNE